VLFGDFVMFTRYWLFQIETKKKGGVEKIRERKKKLLEKSSWSSLKIDPWFLSIVTQL